MFQDACDKGMQFPVRNVLGCTNFDFWELSGVILHGPNNLIAQLFFIVIPQEILIL